MNNFKIIKKKYSAELIRIKFLCLLKYNFKKILPYKFFLIFFKLKKYTFLHRL
jgi:hypothetical protein